MIARCIKKGIFYTANLFGADRLFRHLNRKKLLVVMYHGVTMSVHEPPIWTQLPVELFRRQLEFLRRNYTLLSLGEVVEALRGNTKLPDKAALITFDDGLKNNYKVAFPVLHEMGIPAAVFLTVDFVGTEEILWVDELYLLLREAALRGIPLDLPYVPAQEHFRAGRVWNSYEIMVEALKRSGVANRAVEMNRLRNALNAGLPIRHEDFFMLDWNEVRTMHRAGLVEFGVHTATHRILSELAEEEWGLEIVAPKQKLEKELGTEAASFCFPNGRPFVDFRSEHLDYLRKAGYVCAFTTENALFDWHGGDSLRIGRVPAGNDGTSDPSLFSLNTSGAMQFVKGIMSYSQ